MKNNMRFKKYLSKIAIAFIIYFWGLPSNDERAWNKDDDQSNLTFHILFHDPGKYFRQVGVWIKRFAVILIEEVQISDKLEVSVIRANQKKSWFARIRGFLGFGHMK
jgi:hypothetical protein